MQYQHKTFFMLDDAMVWVETWAPVGWHLHTFLFNGSRYVVIMELSR